MKHKFGFVIGLINELRRGGINITELQIKISKVFHSFVQYELEPYGKKNPP